MNRKQSILLDILLNNFANPKYKGNVPRASIKNIVDDNEELKKLTDSEINKLLYIIRKEQIKIGIKLISGESLFSVDDLHIKDFLNDGGFKKKYWENLFKNIFKYLIPIVTLLILIWVSFIKESDLESKKVIEENTTQKELKSIRSMELLKKEISTDSLKNHLLLKNPKVVKIDSLKVQ